MNKKLKGRKKGKICHYSYNIDGLDDLKMSECYLGSEVIWRLCQENGNRTSWFINELEKDGSDKRRIFYKDCEACVVKGTTLDGVQVLDLVTPSDEVDRAFSIEEDFGGNVTNISQTDIDTMLITRKNGDSLEHMYFNLPTFTQYSNWVDAFYFSPGEWGNMFFMKSFYVNGSIRAFVGLTNFVTGKISPVGYDINNQTFVDFPIGIDSLLDEETFMQELRKEQAPKIIINPEEFEKAKSFSLSWTIASIWNPYATDIEKARQVSGICELTEEELVSLNQEHQKKIETQTN